MAKGNLFLGMGRGSIGDVTFYRADGQQLSRVRNRKPRNPKTNAQLYQRAIMATIIKAYQAGKEIFDHSFQGYSVGAQCQRQFMALNARMLRELVAADVNTPLTGNNQKAKVVAPGSNTPVANSYIISRGTYAQRFFSWSEDHFGFYAPTPDTIGQAHQSVASYAHDNGLIGGDIYTLIVFAEREDLAYVSPLYDDALSMLNYCNFGWIRMIVKQDIDSIDTSADALEDLFEFQSSGGDFAAIADTLAEFEVDHYINFANLLVNVEGYIGSGAIGMIRSRFDQDLRSDSQMYMLYGSDAEDEYGIVSEYILDVWAGGATSVGNSDLILEGGDA